MPYLFTKNTSWYIISKENIAMLQDNKIEITIVDEND